MGGFDATSNAASTEHTPCWANQSMPAADSEPKPRPRDKRKKAAPDAQNQGSSSALQAPLVPDWKRKANEEKAQKQAAQEASMLRVLALHGGGQCGESLKSKMKHLMKGRLKGEVEFHFLDAPFLTRFPHVDPETGAHSYGDEEDKNTGLSEKVRSWWGWNSWDQGDTRYAIHGHDQDGMIYQGIAESLRAVLAEWTKKNQTRGVDAAPYYHGILGFSQGAIVASLFAEMLAQMRQGGDDLLDTGAISSTPRSSAKTFFRENVLPKSGSAAADAAGDSTAATCDYICRLDQPQFLVLVSGFLKPVPINLQWYWRGSREEEESDKDDPPSSLIFDANTPLEDIATELSAENRLGVEGRSVGGGDKNSFVRCRKRFAGAATPTLHLYGENDTVMPNCRSDQLAARFLEPTIVVHKQKLGHDVPQPTDAEALAKVQEFILEQKKRIIMGRLGK